MANPRQRRKAKSSTHKAISHSKRAKRLQRKMPTIRGPKALQDAWDSSKTLRQNYRALGLQHDLNPVSSGGSEVDLSRVADQNHVSRPLPTTSSSTNDGVRPSGRERPTVDSALPKGFGRIVRDSSGNVVRVEVPNDEAGDLSERELTIDTPVVMAESELRRWAHRADMSRGTEDTVVQDLEHLAASVTVRKRHTSLGERSYLARLVEKYGDDLEKMARDRRANVEQRTANELRRAIAKAGGFEVLQDGTGIEVAE